MTLIMLVLISCGTDQGEGTYYEYTIINNSGKNIKINSYRNSYPKRDTPTTIDLQYGDELTKSFKDDLPPRGYDFAVFFQGDSIIINYNNERKKILTFPTENDRNPFFYTGTDVTFTFTQQDYENAEPCNGNCD
ncbi:hypothetical protein R3X25_14280 [Lutibacter sp. TH_r2]|uniref:hypothetical protein n=1 Tax=Lutibacter sp. TH_r2 TaxID=3082083 RepID=UPI0029537DE7|nr:hypothetical protein [Lutibacter sp. TH_r2]MDV7188456.1 hypothetical protein [Lutibacter sp. TH_r2]